MKKTIFLGDSITEGFGVSSEECWVSGMPEGAVNCGISGDTTDGMLQRFAAHVLAERPERVVIMGGLNALGLGKTWEKVATNLREMCELAQKEHIEPILATNVQPDYDEFLASDWAMLLPTIYAIPQQLSCLHDWVREYTKKQNIVCLDFAAAFPERLAGEYCRYFLDGEHPNRFGHVVMREIALETLYPQENKEKETIR